MTSNAHLGQQRLPALVDLALAGSMLVVALLSGLYIDPSRPDTIEPSSLWHWLLLCTPPVLVAFRRHQPVVITGLATVAQAAIWISNLPAVLLPMFVLLYTVASEAGTIGRRVAIGCSIALTAVTSVGVAIADDVTVYRVPLVALTCGIAIVLGAGAADQRAEASNLAATITKTELRAEHAKETAIADERAHIGRELHDIIGHSLSVIAVRAEAADRVADRQPEVARSAVGDIAGAARSALSETRRILSGLQRSSAAELAPPPDLAAVGQLVDDLAAKGVDATLTSPGCLENPPPAVVAGGAYRIVQESLTNAIKHGGPNVRIEVSLRCSPESLDVTIANTVDRGAGNRAIIDTATAGSGVAGMTERVEVLGGTFCSGFEHSDANGASSRGIGNDAGRRFVVEASLPAEAAPRQQETA